MSSEERNYFGTAWHSKGLYSTRWQDCCNCWLGSQVSNAMLRNCVVCCVLYISAVPVNMPQNEDIQSQRKMVNEVVLSQWRDVYPCVLLSSCPSQTTLSKDLLWDCCWNEPFSMKSLMFHVTDVWLFMLHDTVKYVKHDPKDDLLLNLFSFSLWQSTDI